MAKGKKKVGTGPALVYIVLDKSGSMLPIRDATIDGVNLFINETVEADPTAKLSILLFDTEVQSLITRQAIDDSIRLTPKNYRPNGGTALLDAVGRAIKDVDDMAEKPSKVVIAVMTDGEENSSQEYTRAAVKAGIEQHEKEDNWQFLFLGANMDAFAEAGAIGITRSGSSVSWTPTAAGVTGVAAAASMSNSMYLSGMSSTADLSNDTYVANETMLRTNTVDSALKGRLSKARARTAGTPVTTQDNTTTIP